MSSKTEQDYSSCFLTIPDSVSLQHRRDSSFYLCGEVARFIYKVRFRCYTTDTIPLENLWFLLKFQTSEGVYMPVDELFTRLKRTNNVAKAGKQTSESVDSDKSPLSRKRQRPLSLTSSEMGNLTSNTCLEKSSDRLGCALTLSKAWPLLIPTLCSKGQQRLPFDISIYYIAPSSLGSGIHQQMNKLAEMNIWSLLTTFVLLNLLHSMLPKAPDI